MRFTVLAAAILLSFGLTAVVAPSAYAVSGRISGSVDCTYGNNAEVGVWVNASSGADGFAHWSANAYGGIDYWYDLSQSTTSYDLHIGCGGNTTTWGTTMYTYPDRWVSGTYYDWVCGWISGHGYGCVSS
jgi:hypothetical protein